MKENRVKLTFCAVYARRGDYKVHHTTKRHLTMLDSMPEMCCVFYEKKIIHCSSYTLFLLHSHPQITIFGI